MDRVEDWIVDFYLDHTTRCRRSDWPSPGSDAERVTIIAWAEALARVARRHAIAASLGMAVAPPKFLSEHLPALLAKAAEHARREAPLVAPAPAFAPRAIPEDAPEWQIKTPDDLKRFCRSLAASKRAEQPRAPFGERQATALRRLERRSSESSASPRRPHQGDASGLPGDDPVIARERTRPAPRLREIPEDAAAMSAFF